MLVLTRKQDEGLTIQIPEGCPAGEVKILAVDCSQGKCRLGVEAPTAVKVWRDEVLQRMAAGEPPHSRTQKGE